MIDSLGILFGFSEDNQNVLVILNTFSWSAGHMVISGTTGSGRSYEAQLLLLRACLSYDDLHSHIIDPKPDYGSIEPALSAYASINRVEPEDTIKENTEELTRVVWEAYREVVSIDQRSILLVDEADQLLKGEQGSKALAAVIRKAQFSNTAVILSTQGIGDFAKHVIPCITPGTGEFTAEKG